MHPRGEGFEPRYGSGGPLRPPIAGQEKPRPIQSQVEFSDPKKNLIKINHPEILGVRQNGSYVPKEMIQVALPDGTQEQMPFASYLSMFGLKYDAYQNARNMSKAGNQELIRALHKQNLTIRAQKAYEYDSGRDLSGLEEQEGAQKEIEDFSSRLITESGYGKTVAGSAPNDHFDKIDFFIEVDPKKVGVKGKPVYFGIQHTALDETKSESAERLAKKRAIISDQPERRIPEHPEFGLVTRVLIHEDRSNFFPEKGGPSYDSILNQIKRNTGFTPKPSEAFRYNTEGKSNSVSQEDAKKIMLQRVHNNYQTIETELRQYIQDAPPGHFQKDLNFKLAVVTKLLNKMGQDNPFLKPQ